MKPKESIGLFKSTFAEWSEDKVPRLGAALAYYTIFSIAPLLIIAIGIAGLVFGGQAAQGQISSALEGMMGAQGAAAVESMIASANKPGQGIIATVAGFLILILGASGVFGQLKDALNTIWEVPPKKKGGIKAFLKERLFSAGMVLGVGFILLVSLVFDAVLNAMGETLAGSLPGGSAVMQLLNLGASLFLITFIFALLFKKIPDVEIKWSDVWIGAIFTAILFTLGKYLLALYLGRGAVGSSFGAAGSLVVVLVWVYYSSQILFFGAEFTQVYANKYGSHLRPQAGGGTA